MSLRPSFFPALLSACVVYLSSVGLSSAGTCFGQQSGDPAEAADVGEATSGTDESAATDEEFYELFALFADTFDQIERNYVKKVDRRKLVEAAIRGMLDELDPYSSYVPPRRLDRFRAGVEAEFGGVGIQVSLENGRLMVISPLVGTPAYRAGMMAGDRILEIAGNSTKDITLDQAVQWMKGPLGTEVVVKVVHAGAEVPETLTLKREVIRVETVLGDKRNPDDTWNWMYDDQRKIGYIRITAFGRHSGDQLKAALKQLASQGVKALILDLRSNPGGLLSAAIQVSDLFIADGRIVSTDGRSVQPQKWDAHAKGTFADFPMAVLVNRFSASASEIVAACLQDHQRAIVVGERTWGKGSVQNIIELEEGASALKLTTADYHRPSGKNIHRFPDSTPTDDWGVTPNPDYLVELSNEEMGQLLAARRERDIIHNSSTDADASDPPADDESTEGEATDPDDTTSQASATDTADPVSAGPVVVDRQLEKALEYLDRQLKAAEQQGAEPPAKAAA